MVEELLETDRDVLAVAALFQVVCFAIVLEHPDWFLKAAESHEHFDALIPRHCSVVIIVHYQERCFDTIGVENRGVRDIKLRGIPKVSSNTALS